MNDWIHSFVNLPPILSLLAKSTLLLGIGWILHIALRRANPRWQVLIWRFVVVGLILLPVLEMRAKITVPVTPPTQPYSEPVPIQEMVTVPAPQSSNVHVPIETAPVHPAPSPIPAQNAFSLKEWAGQHIMLLWILSWTLGASIPFLNFLRKYRSLRMLCRSSIPVPERPTRIFRRVQLEFPCPQPVDLRSSTDIISPFLTGFLKPVIIIPRHLILSKHAGDLPGIYAHELSHVVARDLYWMAAIRMVRILLWFHPFVWRLSQAHNSACEKVSDSRAATFVGNSETYSGTLARVALEMKNSVPLVGGIPMARTANIVNRLHLLRRQIHFAALSRRQVIISLMLGLLITITIGGLHFAYAAPDSPDVPGERVLHFPRDRSLGNLQIRDARAVRHIQGYIYWANNNITWEPFGKARGDVVIPAGKFVSLTIHSWNDLSCLADLAKNDLHKIRFESTALHINDLMQLYIKGFLNKDKQSLLANDACLKHITPLTGLKELDIIYTNITNRGMKELVKLTHLECLHVPLRLSNTGLATVATMPSIKRLYFKVHQVNNKGLAHLAKMSALEELDLGGKHISDAGLVHLAKLPRLEYISLMGDAFSDRALVHLGRVPSLRVISLSPISGPNSYTDEGIKHLAKLPNLENLFLLDNPKITNAGMAYLKNSKSLKKLNLRRTRVDDDGVKHLKEIRTLESLELPDEKITDRGLEYVSELTNLKSLSIPLPHYNNPNNYTIYYTDKGLRHLTRLKHLEDLNIAGIGVNDAGMEHLATMTQLKKLTLYGVPITNQGLSKLNRLISLQHLHLQGSKLTLSGLNQLHNLKKLRELRLSPIQRDEHTLDISGMASLEKLTLTGSKISAVRDEDLACLSGLKTLKWIQIGGHPNNRLISDVGVAHLAGLPRLERLSLGAKLTDEGLKQIGTMKTLKDLYLHGSFTDAGLRHLEHLSSLSTFMLTSDTKLSSAALDRLRQKLPNCYINHQGQKIGMGGEGSRTAGSARP